jgi:cobalt-zinc-cadmium efflux system protein
MGHGHDHDRQVTATGRHRAALGGALAVSVAIFAVEVVGALMTGSLALLADAGHVLADAGGVALALGATLLAARPATGRRTFGWARAEILAAAVNGLVLAGMGSYVFVEGVRRLIEPTSVGVIVAAVVIATTGFTRADPIVSVLIGLIIVPRAVRLLREAANVLLEATPSGIDLDQIRSHIAGLEHVLGVHDLHVHAVTSGLPVLSAHVVVRDECFQDGRAPQLLDALQACVAGHFDVDHSTFQLEPAGHTDHEHPPHP